MMEVPSPRRFDFEPDGVPATGASVRDEAPALSSSRALARFEFESGRGNEGTKILMVEWSDEDADGPANMGDWEVSWEGKSTVLSAKDGAEGKLHRLYFLLAPGSSVPRIIKLSQQGGKTMQTNPLPAIFPPELGVSATTQGRKGVLHTVWAKKRLSVLQQEIELEMKNGEGVGLEMAIQEKQWIEENFGVGAKIIPDLQYTTSPTSPKSPGGSGRLSEKLRGLKLGTSVSDLSSGTFLYRIQTLLIIEQDLVCRRLTTLLIRCRQIPVMSLSPHSRYSMELRLEHHGPLPRTPLSACWPDKTIPVASAHWMPLLVAISHLKMRLKQRMISLP